METKEYIYIAIAIIAFFLKDFFVSSKVNDKDIRKETDDKIKENNASVIVITSGIYEELKRTNDTILNIVSKMGKMEGKSDSAHKRLDENKEKFKKLEGDIDILKHSCTKIQTYCDLKKNN